MAQSGHFATGFQCPLLEVKRTSARHFAVMHRAKRRVGNPSTFGFFGIPFFWRSRFFLALDGNETAFGGELIGRPLGWIGVSQLARQSDQPFALGMTIRTPHLRSIVCRSPKCQIGDTVVASDITYSTNCTRDRLLDPSRTQASETCRQAMSALPAKSGHSLPRSACQLSAKSGHRVTARN